MTYRVAQISDTHLGRDKPFFVGNFRLVAEAISVVPPDLVLNTGDMSLDGARADGDLAEARRLHDAMPAPVRFIPGNHDLGESHDVPCSPEAPISEASRERYLRRFGDDHWMMDVPGWRFLAINTQLLGSALAAADAQLDFVARAAAGGGDRRLALFVHKPLFDRAPDETAVTGRFVNPEARRRLLAAFGSRPPTVVASGHVHQYRTTEAAGMRLVWCPSTGFIIPDARQPRYGEKEVGFVLHCFHPDGRHEARFIRPPGLERLDICDFPEAYGKLP